ncbi:MAG TPA: hypothetical protein VHR72_10495 [Gemmataceae bacterium]|jgi:hypothetical protein|nr:hypothetical protein [Gemmataceae bacterium]
MCNRPAARPANCHVALVALIDGRSVEAFFDADAGTPGLRDRLGVPLEPDEGPSVELVDVQALGMSILDTLTADDATYIVDQILGLNAPAPSPIMARRPSTSFVEEAREQQAAIALQRASGETDEPCDVLPFPRFPIAFPSPDRAA